MLNKTVIKICFRNFQKYKIRVIITTVIITSFITTALVIGNKQNYISNRFVTNNYQIIEKLLNTSIDKISTYNVKNKEEILSLVSKNLVNSFDLEGNIFWLQTDNLSSRIILQPDGNFDQTQKSSCKNFANIIFLNPTINSQINLNNRLLINLTLFLLIVVSLLYISLITILERFKDFQIMKILGKNLLVKIVFYQSFFICFVSYFISCFLSTFLAIFFGKTLNYLPVAITVFVATIFASTIALTIISKLERISDEFY